MTFKIIHLFPETRETKVYVDLDPLRISDSLVIKQTQSVGTYIHVFIPIDLVDEFIDGLKTARSVYFGEEV